MAHPPPAAAARRRGRRGSGAPHELCAQSPGQSRRARCLALTPREGGGRDTARVAARIHHDLRPDEEDGLPDWQAQDQERAQDSQGK